MDITGIKELVKEKKYLITQHGDKERQNDNLMIKELLESFANGIIIEEYPDTERGESCLVAGFTNSGKPIHIVCGEVNDRIVIITVYIPSPPKFKNLYERG